MTLKELKEITENFVQSGIADEGLVVDYFSFEVPKILEKFFEIKKYPINLHLNLPLNVRDKVAFFSVYYNEEEKYLSKESGVIDETSALSYIRDPSKKVLEICIYFRRIDNFQNLLAPLEKGTYRDLFDLFYYVPLKEGILSVYVEDFIIDFDYYGRVL
jgi:hypothetical protein